MKKRSLKIFSILLILLSLPTLSFGAKPKKTMKVSAIMEMLPASTSLPTPKSLRHITCRRKNILMRRRNCPFLWTTRTFSARSPFRAPSSNITRIRLRMSTLPRQKNTHQDQLTALFFWLSAASMRWILSVQQRTLIPLRNLKNSF